MKRLIAFGLATISLALVAACGNTAVSPNLETFHVGIGDKGCTPGYWGQPHHFDSWPEVIYIGPIGNPTAVPIFPVDENGNKATTVGDVFVGLNVLVGDYPFLADFLDDTLVEALNYNKFGPTLADAVKNLLRHAVAALLNSATFGRDYGASFTNDNQPIGVYGVVRNLFRGIGDDDQPIPGFDQTGLTRQMVLALKDKYDAANNRVCPLN